MPCPKPNDKEPYHVTLRKIYTKNRDIIGVLAHWRKVFAIRQDGLDRGVAYVLEKIRQQHSFRWKSYAKRLMKDCLDNPHYMPSMIGYIIYTNQILDIKEELKQMETWEHSKKKGNFRKRL